MDCHENVNMRLPFSKPDFISVGLYKPCLHKHMVHECNLAGWLKILGATKNLIAEWPNSQQYLLRRENDEDWFVLSFILKGVIEILNVNE